MKIKLIRTSGFIPVIKAAETEVDFTDQELGRLLDVIRPDPEATRIKDGQYFELAVGLSSSPVDLEKVPDEYKPIFNKLKNNLKFIKK